MVGNFRVLCYLRADAGRALDKNGWTKSGVVISWVVCERCGAYASTASYPAVSGVQAEKEQPVAWRAVQIFDSFPETGVTPGER